MFKSSKVCLAVVIGLAPHLGRAATIGDFVWYDSNVNGIQDAGEPGVGGVTVDLLDGSANLIATTTTDSDGNYLFSSLQAENYQIKFGLPYGSAFTLFQQGGDPTRDSDADRTTGLTGIITLAADETNLTLDAGLISILTEVGDLVWNDANRNGIQDGSEVGLGGVTVNLLDSGGSLIASTTTDSDGFYLFTDMLPATYSIEFDLLAGFAFSPYQQGGDPTRDSDADPLTGLASFTLAAGESNRNIDAGMYQVPVPATLALFGLGLAGLGAVRRKKLAA